jgi:hypothetical protein
MGTFRVEHALGADEVRRRIAAKFSELAAGVGATYVLDPVQPVVTFEGRHAFAGRVAGKATWDDRQVTVEVHADRLEGTVEAKVRESVEVALRPGFFSR